MKPWPLSFNSFAWCSNHHFKKNLKLNGYLLRLAKGIYMHGKLCIVIPQPHSHWKLIKDGSCTLLLSCVFCAVQRTLAFSKDYGGVWSKAAGLSILFLLFIMFFALLSAGGSQCGAVSVATESATCFVGGANDENDVFSPLALEKHHLTHPVKCAASAWPRWWMGETLSVARRLWDGMCVLWVCEGVCIKLSAVVICVYFGVCVCALWAPFPSYTA